MSSFARPGVYIQENVVQQTTITQSRTDAVAAFIGQLPKGPVAPTLVSNWSDFVKYFGGVSTSYPTSNALYTFFSNGGRNAYIQRVVPSDAVAASYTFTVTGGNFVVSAINKGSWGTTLSVEVLSGSASGRFSLAVYGSPLVTGGDIRSNVLEQWTDLSLTSTDSRYAVDIINAFSSYISVSTTGTGAPTINGVVNALSGGSDGTKLTGSTLSQITDTLPNFDNILSPLIFNAPDISSVASGANYATNRSYSIATWAKLLKYAEFRGDGFVVIDTPNETSAGTPMSAFDAQTYAGDVYSQAASATSATTAQALSTLTTDGTSVTYTTGTSQHGFLVGQTVTIAGLKNTATITGTIDGTTSSVVKPGYQGTTAVAGYVTYTTTYAHGFRTGDSVTITGVTPTAYNGTYTITKVDGSSTSFYVANTTTATPASLSNATAVSAGFNGSYTITAVPSSTKFTVADAEVIGNPTAIPTASSSYTSNITTITTTGNHNLGVGQTVVIQGVVPEAYNGTWVTAASTATNVLKITTNADFGAITTAGTVSGGLGLTSAGAVSATGFSATTTASVTNSWSAVSSLASNGAIYYPWLKIPDTTKSIPGVTLSVAPGGAVVGQYQATDASRGVFKTPAGYSTRISTAVDVTKRLSNSELDSLNTGAGNSTATPVNAIRNIPGAGIVIMGGRTLANTTPNRYINIRRSLIHIKKQVERISQFALFENNDEFLWGQIRAAVGTFLNQYWQQGGLRGTSPDQAYYVKVDGTTTSDADIANGQVNIQIGVALEYPAEFVVINIGQLTGSSTAI